MAVPDECCPVSRAQRSAAEATLQPMDNALITAAIAAAPARRPPPRRSAGRWPRCRPRQDDARRWASPPWSRWSWRWRCGAGSGDYKVLYANLSDKDGGAVIAQLSQMNVPYKYAEGGNAILVPADTGARPAPEAGAGRPAEGPRRRLRADGQRPLRADPVPGAADLPARPRRRADALDQRARPRCRGARAPGAAEPERLLPRAAEAQRLGAADPARRAARSTARRSPASCTWCRRRCPSSTRRR